MSMIALRWIENTGRWAESQQSLEPSILREQVMKPSSNSTPDFLRGHRAWAADVPDGNSGLAPDRLLRQAASTAPF